MARFRYTVAAAVISASIAYILYSIYKNETYSALVSYLKADYTTAQQARELVIGSSSIKRLPAAYQCPNRLNRGIGGANIADLTLYLRLAQLPPTIETVFIYAGENDIARQMPVDMALQHMKTLLNHIHRQLPQANIHLITLKLSPARSSQHTMFRLFNSYLTGLANELPDVSIHTHTLNAPTNTVGLYKQDGIHLTSAGYLAFLENNMKPCLP